MGIGDAYTIVSSIDGNWLVWSLTNYTWSFIGLCILVFAFGVIIGLAIQYGRLYKKLKLVDKSDIPIAHKQSEIDLLKQKYDTERTKYEAEIVKLKSEIDLLKKEDSAKTEQTEVVKLPEKDFVKYIDKFPDNQKDILAEIYEAGGSIEADSLDGDLMNLAKAGLVSIPSFISPGNDCTWSLTPEINDLITRHPEVVESKRAKELKKT